MYNDQHSTILNNIQRDMRLSRCIIISLTIDELYTDQHSTRHVIESMHNNIELTIIDELYIDQHSTRDMRLSGRIIILLTINQRIVYSIDTIPSTFNRVMRLSRRRNYNIVNNRIGVEGVM